MFALSSIPKCAIKAETRGPRAPRTTRLASLTPTIHLRPTTRRTASTSIVASSKIHGMEGKLNASGLRFGIIVGRFNDLVTKLLLDGAVSSLERHGCDTTKHLDVCWVPGSFELPLLAKSMARSGQYDAIIAIGAVVRGSTTHYDEVCSAATSGLLNAGLDAGIPVVFGVLTCDTMEQALDRAGGKTGNKGYEAGTTAIEMANLLKELRASKKAAGPFLN